MYGFATREICNSITVFVGELGLASLESVVHLCCGFNHGDDYLHVIRRPWAGWL